MRVSPLRVLALWMACDGALTGAVAVGAAGTAAVASAATAGARPGDPEKADDATAP